MRFLETLNLSYCAYFWLVIKMNKFSQYISKFVIMVLNYSNSLKYKPLEKFINKNIKKK